MRILITAGGTREYIDPVRFITNASSGKMGLAFTRAALKAGHKVTLITTLTDSRLKTQDSRLTIIKVETAFEMFKAVKKHFPKCDCLIMSAAVADYTPSRPSKTKIKRANESLTLKLKPTDDILKWADKHKKKNKIIVGFALEDKKVRANAERKLKEKNLDMIIANTPAAIGSDRISIHIKTPQKQWLKLHKTTKAIIAKRVISMIGMRYKYGRP